MVSRKCRHGEEMNVCSTTASVGDAVLVRETCWGTGAIEAKDVRRSGVVAPAVHDWSGG